MEVVEGKCFINGRLEQACIGIDNGKIIEIARQLDGDKVHRFGTKVILPGATDAHVHFREPGMTHKEDFESGSLAALNGGVTCVFDMPNTKPETTTIAHLREKRKLAAGKSLVDFGLFAGLRQGIDVQALSKEAIGFKLYMASTTGKLLVPVLENLKKETAEVSATGKVLAVHAEDEKLRKKDPEEDLDGHLRNRSNECETSAIRKVKDAAGSCRLHICHVSAKESVPLVAKQKNLTSEVTPHHLLLDKDIKVGTHAKVNPPLRKRDDRHALFRALQEDAFDIIASDHAPHTIDEKQEDFDYAPSGMPGVETMVPLMFHLVEEKHFDLGLLVNKLCVRPAEIFGIPKGKIAVGYDADLMVVDFGACTMVKAEKLHSKCGWTAYEGMPAIFPEAVFVRGQIMMEKGHQVGERIGRDVVESAKQPIAT